MADGAVHHRHAHVFATLPLLNISVLCDFPRMCLYSLMCFFIFNSFKEDCTLAEAGTLLNN